MQATHDASERTVASVSIVAKSVRIERRQLN
jgi:hypothetical protein